MKGIFQLPPMASIWCSLDTTYRQVPPPPLMFQTLVPLPLLMHVTTSLSIPPLQKLSLAVLFTMLRATERTSGYQLLVLALIKFITMLLDHLALEPLSIVVAGHSVICKSTQGSCMQVRTVGTLINSVPVSQRLLFLLQQLQIYGVQARCSSPSAALPCLLLQTQRLACTLTLARDHLGQEALLLLLQQHIL
jgi:hypothetical protein